MTGGFTGSENTKVTEIFTVVEDKAWRRVEDLPRARNGLRATNVNNMVYVLGMNILSEFRKHILFQCRRRYRNIKV